MVDSRACEVMIEYNLIRALGVQLAHLQRLIIYCKQLLSRAQLGCSDLEIDTSDVDCSKQRYKHLRGP